MEGIRLSSKAKFVQDLDHSLAQSKSSIYFRRCYCDGPHDHIRMEVLFSPFYDEDTETYKVLYPKSPNSKW